MNKGKKLLNDTLLYGIAQFGSSTLTLLMLPIYTQYFSPATFGTWDIILTTTTLLVPFITFELTSATYRWLIDPTNPYTKKTVISTGFFRMVKNTLIFNTFAISIALFIDFPFKWLSILFINTLIFSNFIQQCTRGLERNKLFAAQGIIQTAIIAILNILFIVLLNMGIESLFYAHIIASITTLIFITIKLNFTQYIAPKHTSEKLLQSYIRYAMPIIPATASWWIMTLADRWFIIGFLNIAQNGIYAIAIKIPAILLMINTVFSLAWKDNVIHHGTNNEKSAYYTNIFQAFFRLLATSVIILTLIAKPIIENFLAIAYSEAWHYTGILLIAMLFHACALFWSAAYHSAKKTGALLTTTIIGASINILLNLALVPFYGLFGIAIATTVAFFITWMMRIYFAREFFNIQFSKKDITILSGIMLIMLPIPFLLTGSNLYVIILISIGLFVYFNWAVAFKVLNYFRKDKHIT